MLCWGKWDREDLTVFQEAASSIYVLGGLSSQTVLEGMS